MTAYISVAKDWEVEDGEIFYAEAADVPLALVRLGGQVCAVHNACPHRGGPLAEGELDDGKLRCPWHGALIDPRTGEASAPATKPAQCFKTRIQHGDIEVAP